MLEKGEFRGKISVDFSLFLFLKMIHIHSFINFAHKVLFGVIGVVPRFVSILQNLCDSNL